MDGAGVETLVRNLLAQTTAALAVGTHVAVAGLEVALEEPCAHLRAKTSVLVHGLGNKDELGSADHLHGILVDNVKGALVDETNVVALLAKAVDSVERAVKHLTERDDETKGTGADDLILAWHELVRLVEEAAAVLLEDEGNLGTGGEDETKALLIEDAVNDAAEA